MGLKHTCASIKMHIFLAITRPEHEQAVLSVPDFLIVKVIVNIFYVTLHKDGWMDRKF